MLSSASHSRTVMTHQTSAQQVTRVLEGQLASRRLPGAVTGGDVVTARAVDDCGTGVEETG